MSGGGSLWQTEQRALTSSSVATGCDDALLWADAAGAAAGCWGTGLAALRAWSAPPNRVVQLLGGPPPIAGGVSGGVRPQSD